jgi:hypothetical protein
VRGQYILNTLYGTNHGQPPLLNWLVIPVAELIGWPHVLVASRFVTACATIGRARARVARCGLTQTRVSRLSPRSCI